MDRDVRRLDYAGRVPHRRRQLGVWRLALIVFGGGWFCVLLVFALAFFIFRRMADEPGEPMTVGRALLMCLVPLAIGLPGLLLAVSTYRNAPRQRWI